MHPLCDMHRAVAKLDHELELNPVLPVVYFQAQLADLLEVLHELADLCSHIMRNHLRAAPLLNELHRRSQSGIPHVRGLIQGCGGSGDVWAMQVVQEAGPGLCNMPPGECLLHLVCVKGPK